MGDEGAFSFIVVSPVLPPVEKRWGLRSKPFLSFAVGLSPLAIRLFPRIFSFEP
jgi:hypothetical protein